MAFDALLLSERAYSLPLVPQPWIPADRMAQFWLTVGIMAVAVTAQLVLDWAAAWLQNRTNLWHVQVGEREKLPDEFVERVTADEG